MRLLRKVEGKKATVALFDNSMQLIVPVYDHLKWCKGQNKEPNTIIAYGEDLKTYFEFLDRKSIPFDQIEVPKNINEFIEFLQKPFENDKVIWDRHIKKLESKRKAKSINRILATVYAFYLQRGQAYNRSFFKIRDKDKENFRILSYDEYEQVLNALHNRRDKLLFKTLYWTGMRIAEALSLTIELIPVPDPDEQVAVIRIKEPPNANKDQQLKSGSRKVYFPMWLIKELDDFIFTERYKYDTKHSFLFVSDEKDEDGNIGKVLTQNAVYQKYRIVSKKLEIRTFTPHSLRHTCCTNLIAGFKQKNGERVKVPIETVQRMMGHKSIATTQKYVHLSDELLREELSIYWAASIYRGEAEEC